MEPNHVILFREIVFAVTRLIFGDKDATSNLYQNLIGVALRGLGIHDLCKTYCSKEED